MAVINKLHLTRLGLNTFYRTFGIPRTSGILCIIRIREYLFQVTCVLNENQHANILAGLRILSLHLRSIVLQGDPAYNQLRC